MGRTGTTSYLPDAVRDGPGEEDPGQDLEPGQHDRRRHNSWNISQVEDGNPCTARNVETSEIPRAFILKEPRPVNDSISEM